MDLKEVDILGDAIESHWYYTSKAAAMRRMLGEAGPKAILDVGAGSGYFSRHLLKTTDAAYACCVDISYDADREASEAGKPVHYTRSIESKNVDLVLLMDVLEHVDDDVGLLKDYVAKVPAGTHVLISVPAFKCLWSGHDEFLEHKRRYTLEQIEHVAHAAGLTVTNGRYYFGLVLPLAMMTRWIGGLFGRGRLPQSQLHRHHPFINWILGALCRLELPLLAFNRFAGLTIFCLAVTTAA